MSDAGTKRTVRAEALAGADAASAQIIGFCPAERIISHASLKIYVYHKRLPQESQFKTARKIYPFKWISLCRIDKEAALFQTLRHVLAFFDFICYCIVILLEKKKGV